MKTSAIVVVAAAAALTNAQTPPLGDNKVNCAKPNATYCMGGDIILRCDGNALGTAGRCSANVSGYPPSGGTAECWESDRLAGDAACKKNCVVYAAQSSYTLPGDQCTPTAQPTSAQPSPPPPSETIIYTIPEGTSPPSSVPTTPGNPETTIIYSIPEGSIPPPNPTTLTTAPGTSSPPAQTTESGIMSIPESSLPPPNTEAPSSTANPSTTPSAPPTPVPTNGASTKSAAGALAALGLVVALFM